MTDKAHQKITQYLHDAHAMELFVAQTLTAHIAMTPASRYRDGLEKHLEETRQHARRIQDHLRKRESERGIMQIGYGMAQGVMSQVVAVGKLPMDIVRGMSGEEKLLKNARDECGTEAMEIASYIALEQLAREVGDTETERLALSIRQDEERQLQRLLDEIPRLTTDVAKAEVEGKPQFAAMRMGAVDAARSVASTAAKSVARSASRTARRVAPETGTSRSANTRPRRKPTTAAASTRRKTTARATTRKRTTAKR